MPTRILIADDHEEIRQMVHEILSRHQDWEVCAVASDGVEVVEKIHKFCPDCRPNRLSDATDDRHRGC